MNTITATTLCAAMLAAPSFAQKVTLKAASDNSATLHLKITSKLDLTQTREVLMDGEPMDFGGRGGGRGRGGNTGPSSITQTVSFDEGDGWRQYDMLEAVNSNASGTENKVVGALAGKKLFLTAAADGSLQINDGEGEAAKPLAANLSRNLPGRVNLAGLLPGNEFEVGTEFDISAGFRDSLRTLLHPVTADRPQNAGGNRGGGRQGGRRGGRGGGGRRGRGGANAGSTIINLLNANKIDCSATGTLSSIEEIDGTQVASIAITAKLSGTGSAEDVGMATARRGGRGGGQSTSTAEATVNLSGTALFNIESGLITSIELNGDVDLKSDSKRDVNFGGMEGEMQTKSTTKGKFELKVDCTQAK